MERYHNVPMSLADACLVWLTEITDLPICTLDTDFVIYRTRRGRALDLISPAGSRASHEFIGRGDRDEGQWRRARLPVCPCGGMTVRM